MEMNVEEFKLDVRKHRPDEVVGLLSSLVQGSSFAKWSEMGEEITNVLDNLTAEIYVKLSDENIQGQEDVHVKMNEYRYWIGVRIDAEEAASSAENILALAVQDEINKATNFKSGREFWLQDMELMHPKCLLQQQAMNFVHDVNPQSTFRCQFDKPDGHVDNCDNLFTYYEANVTSEVNTLNDSYLGAQGSYEILEKACTDAILLANTKLSGTILAYNEWQGARAVVKQAYDNRKEIVCQSSAPSCDAYGDIQNTAYYKSPGGFTLGGLDYYTNTEYTVRNELTVLQSEILMTENNSASLADRNYELHSLNVIHCLLTKVASFNDDNWKSEEVEQIVSGCSSHDGISIDGTYDGNWEAFSIDFKTTAKSHAYSTTSPADFDTKCYTEDKKVEIFSDLDANHVTEVKVSYEVNSVSQFSQTGTGIPAKFNSEVTEATVWTTGKTIPASPGYLCRYYLCGSGFADDCLNLVSRTELRCDQDAIAVTWMNNVEMRTLKSLHFQEYHDKVGPVPLAYSDGLQGERALSTVDGHVAGCSA